MENNVHKICLDKGENPSECPSSNLGLSLDGLASALENEPASNRIADKMTETERLDYTGELIPRHLYRRNRKVAPENNMNSSEWERKRLTLWVPRYRTIKSNPEALPTLTLAVHFLEALAIVFGLVLCFHYMRKESN